MSRKVSIAADEQLQFLAQLHAGNTVHGPTVGVVS